MNSEMKSWTDDVRFFNILNKYATPIGQNTEEGGETITYYIAPEHIEAYKAECAALRAEIEGEELN